MPEEDDALREAADQTRSLGLTAEDAALARQRTRACGPSARRSDSRSRCTRRSSRGSATGAALSSSRRLVRLPAVATPVSRPTLHRLAGG